MKSEGTLPDKLIMVPTWVVEQVARDNDSKRRYDAGRTRTGNRSKSSPRRERRFVAWDGEGPRDSGYALFGCSEGYEICHPYLGTRECLDIILECENDHPTSIHVAYGFNYDVSMILHELPWKNLNALKHFGATVWDDYELEFIPHKWFKVSKDGVTAKIFDIVSFFSCSFVKALESWKVGHPDEIARMAEDKARRSEFVWADIASITDYWRGELRLMVVLANRLRTTFLDAGFDVKSWHGPGSLAHIAMTRHKVPDAMAVTPGPVQEAARYAFAGGRFEMFRAGHIEGQVYNADIRSAYPHFARELPNLNKGKWRRTRHFEPNRFAIYKLRYSAGFKPFRAYPLFRRLRSGEVVWPEKVSSWFWSPEAHSVAYSNDTEIIDGWVFDEDNSEDRPFAWIEEYYHKRRVLKNARNSAEYTFKLIINSIYGQCAQRTGWDKQRRIPPRSHQLEWAGYITSACRASVASVAASCGDKLLSIDTDGITSMAPISVSDVGPNLGQWELTEFDGGIFWQSGIYCLRTGDEWVKAKTRGIPKGSYSAEEMIQCMNNGTPLEMNKNVFTGFGLALNGQRDKINTWSQEPHSYVFGGQGKRYHNSIGCDRGVTCSGGIHGLVPRPVRESAEDKCEGYPHYLPWLGNDPEREGKELRISDMTLYDSNHLGHDEEWVRGFDK